MNQIKLNISYLLRAISVISIYVWTLYTVIMPTYLEKPALDLLAVTAIPLMCTFPLRNLFNTSNSRNILWAILVAIIIQMLNNDHNIITTLRLFFVTLLLYQSVNYNRNVPGFLPILKIVAIILYLLNCGVVIFEYYNHINLLSYELDYFERFRATGLWKHPLQNALIHASTILFIVTSNLNRFIKILLTVLGVYVIFMFDARTSTAGLAICLFLILREQGYLKLNSRNVFLIIGIVIGSYYYLEYLSINELGGKMFSSDANSIENVSTQARIVPFYMLRDIGVEGLFFGGQDIEPLCRKYQQICIENAYINLIMQYGVFATFFLLFAFYKLCMDYFRYMNIRIRLILISLYALVGFTMACFNECNVWYTLIIFYAAFLLKPTES